MMSQCSGCLSLENLCIRRIGAYVETETNSESEELPNSVCLQSGFRSSRHSLKLCYRPCPCCIHVAFWRCRGRQKVKNSHSIKHLFGPRSSNVSAPSATVTVVAALVDCTDNADTIVPFADTEPEVTVTDAGRTAEPEILQCPDAAQGCCHWYHWRCQDRRAWDPAMPWRGPGLLSLIPLTLSGPPSGRAWYQY